MSTPLITSVRNPKVKWVRALQARPRARREAGVFVIEGVRLAEEALATGWQVQLVLHTPGLPPRGQAVVDGFATQGAETLAVSAEVMTSVSDTRTPQGLLAVLPENPQPLPPQFDLLLVLDGVRDPGNLGTMLRSAAAADADAVLLAPETADPLAPKVLRAGMGAHFRLPVLTLGWQDIQACLASGLPSLRTYLASAHEGEPYYWADLRAPLALIIGGEAAGAGDQARSLAQGLLHIPLPGGMESLNTATAAAILLFEALRQRAL